MHKQVCGQKRQLDWGRAQQLLRNRAGTEQMDSPPPLQEPGTADMQRERRASVGFSSSYNSCLQFPHL